MQRQWTTWPHLTLLALLIGCGLAGCTGQGANGQGTDKKDPAKEQPAKEHLPEIQAQPVVSPSPSRAPIEQHTYDDGYVSFSSDMYLKETTNLRGKMTVTIWDNLVKVDRRAEEKKEDKGVYYFNRERLNYVGPSPR